MRAITEEELRQLAGAKSFARGEEYVDAVADVWRVRGGVTATVYGTEDYTVRLTMDAGRLHGTCTCPFGEDGNFCKHCVALGLVLMDEAPEDEGGLLSDAEDDRIHAHLRTLDRETLVTLLWEHAAEDTALYRKLSLHASRIRPGGAQESGGEQTGGPDVPALERQLDRQLRVRRVLDYGAALDYAATAEELVGTLGGVLVDEHAGTARELLRRAVELITGAMEGMDDSEGAVGSVLEAAVSLHRDACEVAPPDPETLAGWLVGMLVDEPSWIDVGIGDYADALGDAGLAAYREKVRALWDALPRRDRSDPLRAHMVTEADIRRLRVTHLMEELARLDGDVHALVRVIAADLSSTWQYVRIATVLQEAGHDAEALAWAERGRKAFPDFRDPRLTDFLVAAYQQAGRVDEAVGLRREAFAQRPVLENYKALHAAAAPVGRWPSEREVAIERLHTHAGTSLAEVLLWEGDNDGAWDAAQTYGCGAHIWHELAERRATTHPADAIPVYQRFAETQIDHRDKASYAKAGEHIERLRDLYERTGRSAEFADYLADIRKRHKPKRNLMAELTRRGL